MPNGNQTPFFQRLSFKLGFSAVIVGACIGLIFSSYQLIADFQSERKAIKTATEMLLTSNLEPAAKAAYRISKIEAEAVVSGLMATSAVHHAEIKDNFGHNLARQERGKSPSPPNFITRLLVGTKDRYQLPLYVIGEAKAVGQLIVQFNLNKQSEKFITRAWTVVITGFIRNLILTCSLAYVFFLMVGKPLVKAANQVKEKSNSSSYFPIISGDDLSRTDEVGVLLKTINHFALKVDKGLIERDHIEEALLKARVEAEALARKDPLSAMDNRRAFYETANDITEQSKRYGRGYSVLMLDIDEFKKVNDNYGHAVGDIVIKEVAEIILMNIRTADSAGRIGGEEFAVILTETSQSKAKVLAERLRKQISARTFSQKCSITISIGIAEYTNSDSQIHTALKRADDALYTAKKTGRNKVITFDDIIESTQKA